MRSAISCDLMLVFALLAWGGQPARAAEADAGEYDSLVAAYLSGKWDELEGDFKSDSKEIAGRK